MNRVPAIALAIVASAAFTTAQAQYAARSMTPKVPGVTTASGSGGFQGADDCNQTPTPLPPGPSTGNPFTTGTTGTTGQNEANCYAFGTTGIDNDVWFCWTDTTTTGQKTICVTFCNGTGVDTKAAVWPTPGCPADGTSTSCNDDACGLQSTVCWDTNSTVPTNWYLQIGTFPGAAGGSGTFDIQEFSPGPCGVRDDGTTENALGLVAGGEIGWLKRYDCLEKFTTIESAYGTAMFPGSVTNGANSVAAVYTDPTNNGDPNTLTIGNLVAVALTTVVNGDTDILNPIDVGHLTRPAGEDTWLLVTADHVAGQFPSPMDTTTPPQAADVWVVGSTLGPGTLDTSTLANNNVPPMNMSAIGFPANWLLRAADDTDDEGGVRLCFGDGSGAPCGCGNESNPGSGGCRNSVSGMDGAKINITGTFRISTFSARVTIQRVRTQPGLFFQGNNTIGGGTGITFGDGIRCCGQNVIRIALLDPPPSPEPVDIEYNFVTVPAGVTPGDKRCYQYWYRDPGGPCGSNFNLSNAVSITWSA
jgi:hypothetical protein